MNSHLLIETYDLGDIEQAVIYTTHCYSYDCPKCGVHHTHDAYGDFEDVYDANHQKVTCSQCQETFRVVFQNAKVWFLKDKRAVIAL